MTRGLVSTSSRLADALLMLLTAGRVFALPGCAVLAWGGSIEPEYRSPVRIGVFIGLAYIFRLS